MLTDVKQAAEMLTGALTRSKRVGFQIGSEGIFPFDPSRPHVPAAPDLFVLPAAKAEQKRSGGAGGGGGAE